LIVIRKSESETCLVFLNFGRFDKRTSFGLLVFSQVLHVGERKKEEVRERGRLLDKGKHFVKLLVSDCIESLEVALCLVCCVASPNPWGDGENLS